MRASARQSTVRSAAGPVEASEMANGGSGGKPRRPSGRIPGGGGGRLRLPGQGILQWYDYVMIPALVIAGIAVMLNIDQVLFWFASMTVRILDLSIGVLLILVILLALFLWIRGRARRREMRRWGRRGGWFW